MPLRVGLEGIFFFFFFLLEEECQTQSSLFLFNLSHCESAMGRAAPACSTPREAWVRSNSPSWIVSSLMWAWHFSCWTLDWTYGLRRRSTRKKIMSISASWYSSSWARRCLLKPTAGCGILMMTWCGWQRSRGVSVPGSWRPCIFCSWEFTSGS